MIIFDRLLEFFYLIGIFFFILMRYGKKFMLGFEYLKLINLLYRCILLIFDFLYFNLFLSFVIIDSDFMICIY